MDPERTDETKEARRCAAAPRDDHLRSACCAGWSCGCEYFRAHGFCAHTIAAQRLLGAALTAG